MLDIDFTLEKYRKLCETISNSAYVPLTFTQLFTLPELPEKYILIRHDVDKKIHYAPKMANIEHEYGIISTYYCRKTKELFKPEFILKIAELGHEIGYHYETMDKAKGDVVKSILYFEQELADFREFIDVKTACMHGNPLAPWANSDMWIDYDFRDFEIIGEPYISIDYNDVMYLTDTGRTWNGEKVSVYDVVTTQYNFNISTTEDVIALINSEQNPHICLLAHPNRWCDNFGSWLWELVWQKTKNIGKRGIIWYRNSKTGY
jgi:hypothetical protein